MNKVRLEIEIDEFTYRKWKEQSMPTVSEVAEVQKAIMNGKVLESPKPKTLLDNVAEWDRVIEKKGYVN